MSNRKEVSDILLLTTLPQRYGHISGVKKNQKNGKLLVKRFYTPEHKNKFFRQIICYIFFAVQAFSYAGKNYKSFDLVFSTSSRLGSGFLGYIVAFIFKKKLALDIRDVFSDNLRSISFIDNYLGKSLIKIIKKIESVIIKKANWVNFVSPGFFEYAHINPKHKKINMFTNGIDSVFIKNRLNYNNINFSRGDILNIVYAGNIGYGQGLEKTVVKIASYFGPKISFTLIGDGSSIFMIENQIYKNNLLNVKIIKPVKREELIKIYNHSDVLFLQLNDVKAFEKVLPSKIFEYGSFNKPLLAGVAGVAKDFIKNNLKTSFIFPPADYKRAICEVNKILELENVKIDNSKFVSDFNREVIMEKMICSLVHTIKINSN